MASYLEVNLTEKPYSNSESPMAALKQKLKQARNHNEEIKLLMEYAQKQNKPNNSK